MWARRRWGRGGDSVAAALALALAAALRGAGDGGAPAGAAASAVAALLVSGGALELIARVLSGGGCGDGDAESGTTTPLPAALLLLAGSVIRRSLLDGGVAPSSCALHGCGPFSGRGRPPAPPLHGAVCAALAGCALLPAAAAAMGAAGDAAAAWAAGSSGGGDALAPHSHASLLLPPPLLTLHAAALALTAAARAAPGALARALPPHAASVGALCGALKGAFACACAPALPAAPRAALALRGAATEAVVWAGAWAVAGGGCGREGEAPLALLAEAPVHFFAEGEAGGAGALFPALLSCLGGAEGRAERVRRLREAMSTQPLADFVAEAAAARAGASQQLLECSVPRAEWAALAASCCEA